MLLDVNDAVGGAKHPALILCWLTAIALLPFPLLTLAHTENKPTVLEIVTYRYRGHSVADPDQTYRSKEEIEEYKKNKDPINLFADKLTGEGILTDVIASDIDKRSKQEADASAEFSAASPFPDPEELMDDIYWETDNPEQRTSKGSMFFEHP